MEKEEIPSKEVNKKRIGCWQLSALFIYGVLIVLSIPLVEGVYLHFLSDKKICNQSPKGKAVFQIGMHFHCFPLTSSFAFR